MNPTTRSSLETIREALTFGSWPIPRPLPEKQATEALAALSQLEGEIEENSPFGVSGKEWHRRCVNAGRTEGALAAERDEALARLQQAEARVEELRSTTRLDRDAYGKALDVLRSRAETAEAERDEARSIAGSMADMDSWIA